MKWRCTWCGKPHAENDPPCNSCGHNAFEKAVVREDEEPSASSVETVDTGTTYVWRCTNCGRDHVKNNPPCARCGNHDLEKTEQTYDDVERDLETPSWLEVAKPYAPVFLVVGVVIALFATGILPLSLLPGIGTPSPPDAPGEGSEAAGIDLEATEREVHDRLEADRDATRAYDDGVAAYAEYANRGLVASQYDDADPEPIELGEFDPDCEGEAVDRGLAFEGEVAEYENEGSLADDVVTALEEEAGDAVADPAFDVEGLDIHVVEGTVHVVYAAC